MDNREKYRRELDNLTAGDAFKADTKRKMADALAGRDDAEKEADGVRTRPAAPQNGRPAGTFAQTESGGEAEEKRKVAPGRRLRRRALATAACLVVLAAGLLVLTRPAPLYENATAAPEGAPPAASVMAGAPEAGDAAAEDLAATGGAQEVGYVRGDSFLAENLQEYGGSPVWTEEMPLPEALPVFAFASPTGRNDVLTLAGRDQLHRRAAEAAAALGAALLDKGEEVHYTSFGRQVPALLFYFEGGGVLAGADGTLHVMLNEARVAAAGAAPGADAPAESQRAWAEAVAGEYAALLQLEAPLQAEVSTLRSADGRAWPIYSVFEAGDPAQDTAGALLRQSLRRVDYQLDTAGSLVGFSLYLCDLKGLTELGAYPLLEPAAALEAEAGRQGISAGAYARVQRTELCYMADTPGGLLLPCYRMFVPVEDGQAPEGLQRYEILHCPALDAAAMEALGSSWVP